MTENDGDDTTNDGDHVADTDDQAGTESQSEGADRDAELERLRSLVETAADDIDDVAENAANNAETLDDLDTDLAELEEYVEERTRNREDLEDDLRRYVRRRVRRGHARGWGPYLVLLYGTAMTLGAFYFLNGVWAILAMLVLWLSTLGLYALMLIVGAGIGLLSMPGRLRDAVGSLRDDR